MSDTSVSADRRWFHAIALAGVTFGLSMANMAQSFEPIEVVISLALGTVFLALSLKTAPEELIDDE